MFDNFLFVCYYINKLCERSNVEMENENINMITFSYEILEKRREKQNNLTRKGSRGPWAGALTNILRLGKIE